MARNNNFGGIIAEEKQISGTAAGSGSSIGSYFQGVASYLPSSIKKQLHISPQTHHNYDDDHDIVLGAEFDKYETASGETHLCLMLSYNNGFQVWDLQHPDGKREVVSVRDSTPIKSIKFLPNPIGKEPPNSLLAGKRPLLAVISAEESTKFPRSHVKFYSLKANDYINLLRFRSPVYTIECNQKTLLVGLRDSIYGFDLVTMERVLNMPCYPSPLNNAVVALGPRWLAYAANQTITPPAPSAISPHSTHAGPGATNYVEVAKDVATDLAKEVAQGLFYLGDMGRKTVTNYLYPDDIQPGPNATSSNLPVAATEYKDNENAGTIIIYDIKTKKNVLHFRAHSQPLSVLRFDPSGTLLVTSSVDGHNFNVFQIGLSGTGSGAGAGTGSVAGASQELTYRHLYKLVRGVTNATIQDICFSADSKWMAVSSTRGTTHIYAINPQGGPVNVLTHVPATNRPPDMLTPHKPDLPVPLVTLSVCNRIKTPVSTDEGSTRNVSAIGSTCRFMGISPTDERLLVLSKNGFLTLYQLVPHPPTQPELDPLCLELAISAMSEADVCRRTKWPEYRQSAKDPSEKEKDALYPVLQEKDMKWLSNVEISTHSPHLRLLWIGCPQFSFRTYQTNNANSSTPSSSSPPYRANMPDLLSTSPPQSFFGEHDSQPNTTNPNTSMGVLFDENALIPTKRIDIRRHEPLPFKESLDDLHSPSRTSKNMSQADDRMKENLLDAISTPMVVDAKPTNYDNLTKHSTEFLSAKGIDTTKPFATSPIVVPHTARAASPAQVSTSPASAHASASPARTPPSPAYTSPPPVYPSTHASTSTSSLSLANSTSNSDTSSTIPNYYSRYTPPSQTSTTTTTTTSPYVTSSPTLPRNSSPPVSSPIISKPATTPPTSSSPRTTTFTAPLSPSPPSTTTITASTPSPVLTATPAISSPSFRAAPIVNIIPSSPLTSSPSTSTPSTSSPSGTSPSITPSSTSPSPTSPTSQPPPSRTIPITTSLKPPTSSPFSISPPFPESEIEKLGKAKQGQNRKSDSEEEKAKKSEGEDSQLRTTKKKKKNKGKHKSAEREQVDDGELS